MAVVESDGGAQLPGFGTHHVRAGKPRGIGVRGSMVEHRDAPAQPPRAVTFGDTDGLGHAVTNASITLIGTLNPAKMTFTNNTVAYTIIGGGGSLAGSGSLVMNGTGLVTINDTVGTPNTFTGGTTINSGTIVINSATALGSESGGLTINAGTLEVTQTTPRHAGD